MQQQKEHLEQLRILQAQILTELTVKSTHQPSSSSVPTSPVTAKEDALQPKAPLSPKPRQSLPTSPLSLDKREATREESEDLTHTRSLSNPQLTTVAMCTLSATLRSATPSPVEASSPNHTPVPSHWLVRSPPSCTKSPPQSPSQGGDIGQIQQEPRPDRPGEFSKGSSFGFLQPGPESTNTSTALVRTSTTESLEQNSQSYDDTTVATCTSLEVSPIKGDEQIEISEGDASPDRSLSNLNVPKVSPSSGKGGMSDTVSPPTRRKLAWTEPTSQQSSVITSLSPPSRNLVVKTSPVPRYLVTPTPHYPVGQLSPRYCSPYNDNSIRPSPGNAGITVATPTAALSRGRGCASPNTTITESQSRALLMEKHRKHMDDLKTYYESELSQLHSRLEQLEAERNDPSFTSTTARRNLSPHSPSSPSSQKSPNSPRKAVHQLYFPSSLIKSSRARTPSSGGGPSDGSSIAGGGEVTPAPPAMAAVVNESELWMLQNENARLKSECAELHGQVDVGERERHALEEQVKRMQNHNVSIIMSLHFCLQCKCGVCNCNNPSLFYLYKL